MAPPIPALRQAAAAIPPRLRPDRITLALIALSLLAAGFVLLRAYLAGGLGLSGPGIAFIALARNIIAGNGLVEILTTDNGRLEPFVLWPPLYPFALVIFSFGVFDPYDVATPVNAAIIALTVFTVGHYLRRIIKSQFVLLLVLLAVAASPPLVWISAFAISEALFVLMTVMALIYCDKYLEQGKTSALIWTAVFSALAWQTRYIGLALPAAIGLMLLLHRDATLPRRAKRVALYSLIVTLPMALWALHYISAVGISRRRYAVDYSLADLWNNVADALAAGYERILLLPYIEAIPVAVWIGIAVLLNALAVVFVAILWRGRRSADWRIKPIALFGGFALVYMASVAGAAFSGLTHDGFEVRYLVPITIPLLIVAALVADTVFGMIHGGRISGMIGSNASRWAAVALTAIIGLSVAAMLTITALDTSRVRTSGIGYVSALSELNVIQHLQANPVYDVIHSNAPFIIYFYTDGNHEYHVIPPSRLGGYRTYDRNAGISGEEQLRRWAADLPKGAYVVWLNDFFGNGIYDFGPAEMRASPALDLVQDLGDGVIFRAKGAP